MLTASTQIPSEPFYQPINRIQGVTHRQGRIKTKSCLMLQQWHRVDYAKGRARLCRPLPPPLSLLLGHFLPLPSFPSEAGSLKSSYGVWGSAVSSHSGVWGKPPAEIEFGALYLKNMTSGGNNFNVFPEIVPIREITTKTRKTFLFIVRGRGPIS